MNTLKIGDRGYEQRLRTVLATSSLFDPIIEDRSRAIVQNVQKRGDEALAELTARFDGAELAPDQFEVSKAERLNASLQADAALRKAVDLAHKNILKFARKSLRKSWSSFNAQGARVGEKFDPFQRVGVYIPGGAAPLVSTSLMTVALAKAAGCPEVIVCTPCHKSGQINAALLFALNAAGADRIFRMGGAQAIAAMALGTNTIPQTHKIFGPGNAYVVAAKRLLFGHVAIDLLPGPSEVLVLADDTANPAFIAADLLAQAEHGSGHERVWLVTPSARLLKQVEKEIAKQLPKLKREEFIRAALRKNGWLIQTASIEAAVELTNRFAPEHLEIMARQAQALAKQIVTAGAIFIGPYSPTVLGDYVAGPSHVLPTGGAGRSFPGLTVDQFLRRTSVVEYSRGALSRSLAAVAKFAEVEGLDAHGRSASIRLPARSSRKKASR